MARRASLWHWLERLTSFLPSGPHDQPPYPGSMADPNEPGISPATRRARLHLLLKRYEKGSRGGGR